MKSRNEVSAEVSPSVWGVLRTLLALLVAIVAMQSAASAQTTIWSNSTTPAVLSDPDQEPVELGVKFRSNAAGSISAIRFFKSTANVGPHVVKLYTGTGTLLASVNATGTTASGWQQIALPQPVQIAANATYVASYYTASGRYSINENYFTASVTNGPLTALASGVEGGNGVYRYGTGGFPAQTFRATNYWVDVVFTASTTGAAATTTTVASSRNPSNTGEAVTFTATVAAVPPASGTPTGTVQFRVNGSNFGAPVSLANGSGTSAATSTLAAGNHNVDALYGGSAGFSPSTSSVLVQSVQTQTSCTGNDVVVENCLPGNPASEWEVSGEGDVNIQGFATDISVNRGQPISFKVRASGPYRLDIYRLGYYGGMGARRVTTISSLPARTQPNCQTEAGTGLIDCGNWSVAATWNVPSNATSGIYIARARLDSGGASHIVFVVRNDDSSSDLLFQTSDTTWQAYNDFGGNSLYRGNGSVGRAYKVSYNRPFRTRAVDGGQDWLFNAEYPLVRWLERNGYDVTYFTGVDSDRHGDLIRRHAVFLSVGHDEYWSKVQRENVEVARNAGTHLAFFSGNEVFWKTRWESSIDSSSTAYRTLVTYKETHANAIIDPSPEWTGTWRDPRFSPPKDGGRPENALTGTLFMMNDTGQNHSIVVPAADGRMRFWRNTSIANLTGTQTATLPAGTLGYEWDGDVDNGARPAGLIRLSTTTTSASQVLQDHGSTFGNGTVTHHLSLYRHPSSRALVFGAGTIQWPWGLDSNHDRGSAAADVRMQQATVNLFADMGVQPGTLQSGLVATAASGDVSPPASTITAPTAGATLAPGTTVTIAGTAADTGGVVGGVEVSVDGGTTWHAASGRASWSFTWTTPSSGATRTIRSRAVDDNGNLESPTPGVTVTIGSGSQTCPCTLFGNAAPTVITDPDSEAVELGVKFRANTSGSITAIRFYKGSSNTGPHVVKLWSSTGTLLASAQPQDPNAPAGWQTVALPVAVGITANTTYIASYHTASGFYSANTGFFNTDATSGPLTAPASSQVGGNGVYAYGPGGFPTQTFNASNYWVDVVFTTGTVTDTMPPQVVTVSPAPDATQVSTGTAVRVTFNEPMLASSIGPTTVELRDSSGNLVPASVTYNTASLTATLTPNASLSTTATYSARVRGGTADPRVKDTAGNPLTAHVDWSFTTGGLLPTQGPGGPILLITSSDNPFSTYYAEILRTEGLNLFQVADIGSVSGTTLNNYKVVLLGQMSLSAAQVTLLSNWVSAGGNLIAMRPDKQLAGLLGLTDLGSTLTGQYLLIDNASNLPGRGLVNQTIQYRGIADRYTVNDAVSVATLYSNATTATSSPAVTLRNVGANGGKAAAFTYDLARSIVFKRQGNPAWSGLERDGAPPIRSNDLFFGASVADPQLDWVDLNKVAIPQADEQQRLLANLILFMTDGSMPLPRFWYFPRGLTAVVIMTGDDHGNGGTAGRFNQFSAASPSGCVLDRWECIRGTSYVYPGTPITDAQAAAYDQQGFEIGLHVSTGCGDFTQASLNNAWISQLAQWSQQYPSLPPPTTNRTHCIVWSDYATQPLVELSHGIRLDTNYYYWPPAWVNDRPGFFTGSGMPMRHTRPTGEMIDVYHAVSQMTDESQQSYPFTIDTLLDRAVGPLAYYGAFTINAHTDAANSTEANAVVASAKARGVPVITARQMLRWLDGRNNSHFSNVAWNGSTLSFSITTVAGARDLQAMVPVPTGRQVSSVTKNGSAEPFGIATLKGVMYVFVMASTANYQVVFTSGAASLDDAQVAQIPVPAPQLARGERAAENDAPRAPYRKELSPAGAGR
jgi:large repetitive protein